MVVAELDIGVAGGGEEVAGFGGEGGVDLHEYGGARGQELLADAGDGAIETKGVVIGDEKGQGGLMMKDGGVDVSGLGSTDVGRVADEKPPVVPQGGRLRDEG